MPKLTFSKLGLKFNIQSKVIRWNECDIEVIQYLPTQEKLGLISRVITQSHEEDENYSNPLKIKVFTALEVVFSYTNITFTEKQKEDLPKLYDTIASTGLLEAIIEGIPSSEYKYLTDAISESTKAVYDYQNSAYGIVEGIKSSYLDTDMSLNELQQKMNMLQNNDLLKLMLTNQD